MNKAVFLDRDGTINVDYGYVSQVEKFEFLPGAVEGLLKLKAMGFLLIIVSNQSGIGRGYYTEEDYERVTAKMVADLKKSNLELDDFYYCPHSPESNCPCRKPGTLMVERAIKKWNIDAARSFFVGDKDSDIKAGKKCGLTTLLITSQPRSYGQNYTVGSLSEAAAVIEKMS